MRHTLPLVLFSIAAALVAPAQAAQSVQLTAGPTSGVAPFEADLRVMAEGPDDEMKLDCGLVFGDETGAAASEIRFVLQPPWPAEAVFTHTYRYSGTFAPDVTCVGAGTIGDGAQVVVTPRTGNRPPQLDLTVAPATGPASVARTLTVRGIADADGDTLDCFVDFDVNPDLNFSGGATSQAFTVAPPYNDVALPYSFSVARTFHPNVFCVDGKGGSATDNVPVTIAPVAGNRAPTVLLDRMFPADSEPGVSRRFRVRPGDPDNDVLRCQFRPTWDSPREWFTSGPPYAELNFYRTFRKFGTHLQAYALCVDPKGTMTSINRGFEVDVFPTGNGFPVILDTSVTPETGELSPGLDVAFELNAFDPDGQALACDVQFGHGQGGTTLPIPVSRQGQPNGTEYTYTERGSHGATIVCHDGALQDEPAHEWVHVYEQGKRFPTVAIDADPSNGNGLLPVTLTLSFDDPDGDTLACHFSYGTPYAGGGALPDDIEFQVAAPHAPVVLQTTYGGTHRTELSCVDATGRRHDAESWIQISPFNQAPAIDEFAPNRDSSTRATLFVNFAVDVSDPNLDQAIDCELDFGDGIVWPLLRFAYPNYQPLSVSHLYNARNEPYEAVLTCNDNEGGNVTASRTIKVGAAAATAPTVEMRFRPRTGYAPFQTTLSFLVADVDTPEGDMVACRVNFGDGSAPVVVDPASDRFGIRHTYVHGGAYLPTVTCTDSFGKTTTLTRRIVVAVPGGGSLKSAPVRLSPR